MKNLHKFLSNYSHCPICNKDIFTEIMITFDAFTRRAAVPFKLNINYIKDTDTKNYFKYVKYRDDDDRKYDPGFDRAANEAVISKDGSFMFDSNIFAPDSYLVYGYCPNDHFIVETSEVYLHSLVVDHRKIRIAREELQVKNYKIINDYLAGNTKVYVNDCFPAKLTVRLSPSYAIKNSSAANIVAKIESLLVLTP